MKKGFTLIEMIITLALLGIVMTAISSFFLINYRTLNNVSKELDFQREGEKAINLIIEKAMESKGIGEIQPHNNTTSSDEKDVTKVVFKIPTAAGEVTEQGHVFSLIQVNGENQLRYGKGTLDTSTNTYNVSSDWVIARGIKSIELKSGQGEALKEARSVEVIIILDQESVKSQVYFRNKE